MSDPSNSWNQPTWLPPEPKPTEERKLRAWQHPDFWGGVALFISVNVFMYILYTLAAGPALIGFAALLVNLGLLLYFRRVRPRIAAGILYSIGCLFLLGLVLGVFIVGMCWWYQQS